MAGFSTASRQNGTHLRPPSPGLSFLFVQPDGWHGVTTLPTVREWARSISEGEFQASVLYTDLYLLKPNAVEAIHCEIGIARDGQEIRMQLVSKDPNFGPVLHQETL